jgi:hypothetical protein
MILANKKGNICLFPLSTSISFLKNNLVFGKLFGILLFQLNYLRFILYSLNIKEDILLYGLFRHSKPRCNFDGWTQFHKGKKNLGHVIHKALVNVQFLHNQECPEIRHPFCSFITEILVS